MNAPPRDVLAYIEAIKKAYPEGTIVAVCIHEPDKDGVTVATNDCLHCIAGNLIKIHDKCSEGDFTPFVDVPRGRLQ